MSWEPCLRTGLLPRAPVVMLVFNWNHVCSGKRRRCWLVSAAAEGWAPCRAGGMPCPAPCLAPGTFPPPRGLGQRGCCCSGTLQVPSSAQPGFPEPVEDRRHQRAKDPPQPAAERGWRPGVRAGWEGIAAGVPPARGEHPAAAPGRSAGLRGALPAAVPGRLLPSAPGTPGEVALHEASLRLRPTGPFGHASVVSPDANLIVFRSFLVMHEEQEFLRKGVNGLTETNLYSSTW